MNTAAIDRSERKKKMANIQDMLNSMNVPGLSPDPNREATPEDINPEVPDQGTAIGIIIVDQLPPAEGKLMTSLNSVSKLIF